MHLAVFSMLHIKFFSVTTRTHNGKQIPLHVPSSSTDTIVQEEVTVVLVNLAIGGKKKHYHSGIIPFRKP